MNRYTNPDCQTGTWFQVVVPNFLPITFRYIRSAFKGRFLSWTRVSSLNPRPGVVRHELRARWSAPPYCPPEYIKFTWKVDGKMNGKLGTSFTRTITIHEIWVYILFFLILMRRICTVYSKWKYQTSLSNVLISFHLHLLDLQINGRLDQNPSFLIGHFEETTSFHLVDCSRFLTTY